ncbi:MAG: 30S ribosomal protein S12 methylthiotransferase RimO [Planctomycetes bacterium]|nr:30S ribosomal protein S12 methylthiotransferase RimO [Planctomycetota bacterium]MDA0946993.1 30S ribosomal protein S12 methylthiotransferase RimO [Planctomycetota bacterium]
MSESAQRAEVVSLVHLGCARNLIDSELILARLAEQELLVSGDAEHAGTVVLNTCSFIGPAREESYAAIRGLLDRKQAGSLQHVVVAGCLVQRYRRKLAEQFPAVDLWAEISDYRALAREVRGMVDGTRTSGYLEGPGLRPPEREDARLLSTPGSYAYLRISHGCDHTCGFCAIPSIRGPHRSKRPAAVVEEAQELIAAGVRELVLVAEDSTAWGRDIGLELPRLVEELAELDGDHRLRVMYAYPNRFPWDLTRLLREHPRVEPYLDIPIQHAATPVLRAMGRAGSGDQVRRTLDRLLEEVPGVTLRTTVLLGYPGETDADAEELVRFVEEYRLARLGAFTYSDEEGTPAHGREGQVLAADAQARLEAVLAARDRNLDAVQGEQVGREVEVLIDEDTDEDGEALGRTSMDAPEVDPRVLVEAEGLVAGDRVRVRVTEVTEEFDLVGELA